MSRFYTTESRYPYCGSATLLHSAAVARRYDVLLDMTATRQALSAFRANMTCLEWAEAPLREHSRRLEALAAILKEGAVGISHIGQDKYGGRVDADARSRRCHARA